MAATQQLANYVQTTLASACTNVATTISVVSAAGLPTAGNFMLRIDDPAPATTFEYVECTGVSGTTLTVTRGQEGTTGIAHSAGAFVGNDITAAMLQRAFPGGMPTSGYAQITAASAGFTTEVDITGLSVTIVVPAGRRIMITVAGGVASTVGGDTAVIDIKEGSTYLQRGNVLCSPASLNNFFNLAGIVQPTAGSHTYKVSASRNAGTGTLTISGDPTFPSFILVEDIGPA